MKNFLFALLILIPIISLSQIEISFESEENYNLGNINNQNDWKTFIIPEVDIIYESVEGQEVTSAKSSEGNNSLKTTSLETFPEDFDGFFGVSKLLNASVGLQNSTEISFDVYIDMIDHSDYIIEFLDSGDLYSESVHPGIQFFYSGEVLVPMIVDGEIEYTETNYFWQPNTWMNIKIRVEDNNIKYYVNNTIIYSSNIDVYGDSVNQIFVLTDNYGGNMFLDNIIMDSENLGINIISQPKNIRLVLDNNNVKIVGLDAREVASFEIYNSQGKLINQCHDKSTMGISHLPKGVYYVHVLSKKGSMFNLKFIN